MGKALKSITILSIIHSVISTTLTVLEPKKLIQQLNSPILKQSLGDYGRVPYGHKMVGKVVFADPPNACSPLKPINATEEDMSAIIVVVRGECTFVTKSRYAQIVGAKVVLIADIIEENVERVIMIDDGNAASLNIPTLLIPKKEGDTLINYSKDHANESIILNINFEANKNNTVKYNIWISFDQSDSFQMLSELQKVYNKLGNAASFEPHYLSWSCFDCDQDNCLCGNKYCSFDPDGEGPTKGKDIIYEQLRQLCIYQQNPEKWFEYVNQVKIRCNIVGMNSKCNEDLIQELRIDLSKVKSCVNSSFQTNSNEEDDNIMLRQQRIDALKREEKFWPSLSINGMEYRGNLLEFDFGEAICADFIHPPASCKSYLLNKEKMVEMTEGNWGSLFIVFAVIVLLFFVVLNYLYRRRLKQEMHSEMSHQVNEMVANYLRLQEKDKDDENTIQ